MVPWVPVAAGFCDGDGQPLVLVPVLTRDPALGDYQAVLTGATAGQGFWARCRNEIHDAGVESAPVPGRLRDGIVRLKPGWNMVGPAADLPVEEVRAVAGVQGPVWYWEQTMLCYVAVPDGSVLTRGRGYWIYATQDVNITPLRAAGRD